MSDILYLLLGFLGFIGLFYGGNVLVKGTVQTANVLNIPAHLIAITIVALGTSAPELVVSINAVLKGSPDLAWGNVVGSNIANLLLVIGGACLFITLKDNSKSLRLDIFWMVLSTLIIFIFGYFFRSLNPIFGFIFVLTLLIILIIMTFNAEKNEHHYDLIYTKSFFSPLIIGLCLTLGGIAVVLISSEILISSAIKMSMSFGIEQSLIGVTIVALGTSLPEISASVAAARNGHTDIAIGNVLGSNLFNCLGILGASLIASYPKNLETPLAFINYDLPIMLLATLMLGGYLFYFKRVERFFGPLLIILYMLYISFNFIYN